MGFLGGDFQPLFDGSKILTINCNFQLWLLGKPTIVSRHPTSVIVEEDEEKTKKKMDERLEYHWGLAYCECIQKTLSQQSSSVQGNSG